LSHTACIEAYAYDTGATYACTFGCGVNLDAVVASEIAEISLVNNLIDMFFVSRVVDMLSHDDEVSNNDVTEEWSDEIDVYMAEVCVLCSVLCYIP